ncbi:MAG: alpha-glucan family phosphorylase, partial [Calditrichia bacterium]
VQEVPIGHITNGVHAGSWTSRKTKELFNTSLGPQWLMRVDDQQLIDKVIEIPDEALWKTKQAQKEKMLNHVKERLESQFNRNKMSSLQMLRIKQLLKPGVLTIGFARRFATYKRGTLIFRNIERLKKIVTDPQCPVQIIFAGKAHPKDSGGQDLIRQIHHLSLSPELRGRVIFVENYDMSLARDLVSGVDIWLNNPRRTQEASGTSGQKLGMNGGINFSVLDGWWEEGFNGENGWAFGDNEDFLSLDELDSWDSEELYDILENDIIPLYYERDDAGLPRRWIQTMKNSIKSVLPVFNTHRMLKDYFNYYYKPAMDMGKEYRKDRFKGAKEVCRWLNKIEQSWDKIKITSPNKNGDILLHFGEKWNVKAQVNLGDLQPQDVKVQLYLSHKAIRTDFPNSTEIFELNVSVQQANGEYLYEAEVEPSDSGNYNFALRVLPFHPLLPSPYEVGLVRWSE